MSLTQCARLLAVCSVLLALSARADDATRIGTVDTTFRVLGRNDRIVVEGYDDPRVDGVSCYMSRAETGGVKGSIGLATDPNRFSIACRATGPVAIRGTLPEKEVVFGASASWLFKEIRVTRLFDQEKRVLVYLVWSTQTLSTGGSAFNSVTAVSVDAR
ncbi:MAG: CreA family protein [Acetobacteraceae bacterium]|nr:CreA family protein [Acetobacteraceae bacterium]